MLEIAFITAKQSNGFQFIKYKWEISTKHWILKILISRESRMNDIPCEFYYRLRRIHNFQYLVFSFIILITLWCCLPPSPDALHHIILFRFFCIHLFIFTNIICTQHTGTNTCRLMMVGKIFAIYFEISFAIVKSKEK